MSADLQTRFAEALRRALSGATEASAPPTVHVDVQPAAVSISPVIKATLPALTEPVLVEDVGRFAGAFEFEVRPVRDRDGVLVSAKFTPTAFVHFEVKP